MAQTILCDSHNLSHPADVVVTQISTGDVSAHCNDGFLEFCRGIVELLDAQEREATDAHAIAQLEGVTAPALAASGDTDAGGAVVNAPPADPETFPAGSSGGEAGHVTPQTRLRSRKAGKGAQTDQSATPEPNAALEASVGVTEAASEWAADPADIPSP